MDNADFPAVKRSIDFDSGWRGDWGVENSPELATGKPLYGVKYLVEHVGVGVLAGTVLPSTFGALLVFGGHTELFKVTSLTNDVQLLDATIDDAAGEAYSKTARLLGLGYPGGPAIDRAGKNEDKKAFRFPRGLSLPKFVGSAEEPGKHWNNFSFSGLKTAVARCVEHFEAAGEPIPVADISASFQEAVVDVITSKAVRAMQEHGLKTLLLGGGVAANTRLRELLAARCASAGITLVVPPFSLCTDNGGMVAPSGLDFAADSSQPVTSIVL
ncbi:tRNA (adenosine(37)-N6)-threonylcarbamoyltransferase complex transferase subunit TsaD [Glutamicibacter ardleyensis]|uniref:tRNA (adenosine(37)-N6)-threonylcarbamoyltransferase complex transferase subunit TsaD n=1 Tax=Glutamicibacter ardleyensis TaxID=225894 RepID=UPI003FB74CDF